MSPNLFYLATFHSLILFISAQEVPTPSSTDIIQPEQEANADNESCVADDNINKNDPLYLLDHVLSETIKNYECENPGSYTKQQCDHWLNANQCTENRNFMMFNCPQQCGFCHLFDPKIRCQRHPNAVQAVHPGDIDQTMHRILTQFPEYSPQILHEKDPWVILLHDVYTEEECDAMIKIGGRNFKRSVDAGKMSGNEAKFESVVSDARTSSNDWCVTNCWDHPIINGMAQRAENITQIPKENSEYFQVLKYEEGQYYVQHTDFIGGHLDLPIGPRVYTYYIYLNDVEQGGETKFNKLGIAVTPKRGNVVLWNNVKNENPFQMVTKANHEALPVKKGVKYGANMWIHMFNFHQPFKISCTG